MKNEVNFAFTAIVDDIHWWNERKKLVKEEVYLHRRQGDTHFQLFLLDLDFVCVRARNLFRQRWSISFSLCAYWRIHKKQCKTADHCNSDSMARKREKSYMQKDLKKHFTEISGSGFLINEHTLNKKRMRQTVRENLRAKCGKWAQQRDSIWVDRIIECHRFINR